MSAAGSERGPLVTRIAPDALNFGGFRDLWRTRELIRMLVYRNLISKYKQTILGPVWLVIMPLLHAIVLTIIFGKVAGIKTDGMPQFLFFLAGTVCWSFVSQSFAGVGETFVANSGLITKVYFPRLALPIATIATNAVSVIVYAAVLACATGVFIVRGDLPLPHLTDLWVLPLVFLQLSLTALGMGCLFAAITVTYRDLTYLSGFLIQFWMYATPVVYPASLIPERFRLLYALNPASGALELFRSFVAGRPAALESFQYVGWMSVLLLLVLGLWLFFHAERDFADRI